MELQEHTPKPEKSILISVGKKGGNRQLALEYLSELEFLAETAGAEIYEKIYQEPDKPNASTLIGKGKKIEIKELIDLEGISLVIFDNELNPVQVRNLENFLKVKVMDRTGLILDIFARHARTIEAKTQVELAQLEYLMPRLTRLWTHLSKQYGGIGTKGPGETQIETDRRMIKIRIQRLKEKLNSIDIQKEVQRRGRSEYARFALVGYTNAGKSTLMNHLTDAGVYVENKLFATLDTTVRKFEFESGLSALISDTVGFIRKLPAHLVASFRSTLMEAAESDVLLHIVDTSHEFFRDHIKVVNQTLEKLKINNKPTLLVFNKVDALEDISMIKSIEQEYEDCIFISAEKGINIGALKEKMLNIYNEQTKILKLQLPYSEMDKLNDIYAYGDILKRIDNDYGIEFEIKVASDKLDYFNQKYSKYYPN